MGKAGSISSGAECGTSSAAPPGRFAAAARSAGTVVGFTTTVLRQARLRIGADGSEVLVPVTAGNQNIIVVALKQVADAYPLNRHDHELVTRLAAEPDLTLDGIRHLRLSVAAGGFGDAGEVAGAQEQLKKQEMLHLLTRYYLIRNALRAITGQSDQAYLVNLDDPGNRQRLRDDLAGIARRMGTTPDGAVGVLETWGQAIRHIGLPETPEPGLARELMQQIAVMADELAQSAEGEDGDMAASIIRLANGARALNAECAVAIRRLDQYALSCEQVLTRWKRLSAAILSDAENVDWALDGWGEMVADWRVVRARSPGDRFAFVARALRHLPLVAGAEGQQIDEKPRASVRDRMAHAREEGRFGVDSIRALG